MRGGETEIFDGKTLSELLKDIYNISSEKRGEIQGLIIQLSKMVNTESDAINLAPIIQQMLEVSVKNDDQLVKMATVVQRLISAEITSEASIRQGDLLSEEEKEQLTKNAIEMRDAIAEIVAPPVVGPKLVK